MMTGAVILDAKASVVNAATSAAREAASGSAGSATWLPRVLARVDCGGEDGRYLFKGPIEIKLELFLPARDIQPHGYGENSDGNRDPGDRPEQCGNSGSVCHVHRISRDIRAKRLGQVKDCFQIEQSIQYTLNREEAYKEGRHARSRVLCHCDQTQAE